jgi:spermidine synthase
LVIDVERRSIAGSWYCDGWDPNLKIFHRIRSTLFARKSAYQTIEVCDTYSFGRMLIIDGIPQAAELDEAVYAISLSWPALLARSDSLGRVLIIGGGDGHVAREALKFPSATSVVVCDIDPLVTEVTQRFMPFMWRGVVGDSRLGIKHLDALDYLASVEPASIDVLISDITDPTGDETASEQLYSAEYFTRIRRCLAPGGICVVQAQELSIHEWTHHHRLRQLAAQTFPCIASYFVHIPSFGYPEGFLLASDAPTPLHLTTREVEDRLRILGLDHDPFFSAEVYRAMFALPDMIRAQLATDAAVNSVARR